MLKLTVAIVALVLAGTASAAGWRSLRIDASSEASFAKSVEEFRDKLTPSRRVAFVRSLQDIRIHGSQLAVEGQREYTDADFLRQIHGLGYEQIVTLTDPTGKKEGRYRAEYYTSRAGRGFASAAGGLSWSQSYPPPVQNGTYRGDPSPPNTADTRAACGCMFPGNAPP
jgi:hypothetical protein